MALIEQATDAAADHAEDPDAARRPRRAQRAKPVAFLLADLGITKTHSRPYTSSDNPYSESNFKTLQYRPEFPPQFTTSTAPAVTAACSSTGTTTSTATPGSG